MDIAAPFLFLPANELLAFIAFAFLVAASVALCLPGAIATSSVIGGMIFGPWAGIGAVAGGSLLGCMIAFGVVRRFGGGWLRRRFPRQLSDLHRRFEGRGSVFVMLARLAGIPYFLVNLGFALTAIKSIHFAGFTLLGLLPHIVLYAAAGSVAASAPLLVVGGAALLLLIMIVAKRRGLLGIPA